MRLLRQNFLTGDKPSQEDLANMRMDIQNVLNNLGFGDPNKGTDNMAGVWFDISTPGTANTDFTLTHNLGIIPTGYLVFSVDKAAIIYKGSSPWTTSSITLRSSQATTLLRIFVL